jgi:hypothetical protein
MDDRENEGTQREALEDRLRAIEEGVRGQIGRVQESIQSQFSQVRGFFEQSQPGKQLESLARELKEQAGHMWQEFEKRMMALDDARQALEDRIGRQIDNLLKQQRSFARQVEARAGQAPKARAKASARKTATRKSAAKRPAKKSTASKPSARRSSTKRSTAKRASARRSTAKRS